MDFLGLDKKTILITGAANKKSVATHVASVLIDNGASIVFSVQNTTNYKKIKKLFPDSPIYICDVENKESIDLVILDMIMPDMGGGEAYDRIKEINPRVKVLLSSGYSIDGQATEIMKRGCDGFIQKPFKADELSEKLKKILAKK